MKRCILAAAIGAIALAGAAIAQAQPDTRSGPIYGYQAPEPAPPYSYLPDHSTKVRPAATVVRQASEQFKMACAADRETFCKDRKSADDVLWCIKLRRSKLTGSCRSAWDNLVMASQGRL
jgi:hypothetical protein